MYALYDSADVSRAYYGTDTRASGILLGAALAAALAAWGPVRSRAARIGVEALGLAGVLVLFLAWTRLDGQESTLYRGGFLVCGLAAIAVIAAATHPQAGIVSRVLSFRPLCLLGLISYGVYLWHWPVDIVVNEARTGISGWPLFFVQCAITLAISIASYQLLEMPIRRGALTGRQWAVVTPAVAAGLVALVIIATAGAQPAHLAAASPTKSDVRGPRVLVVGDSVPRTIVPGLQNEGFNAIDGGVRGCRLLAGEIDYTLPTPDCRWPGHWRRLLNREQPEYAVLSLPGWDLFDIKPPGGDEFLVPGTKGWNRYYEDTLLRAIRILGSRGAKVVVPTMPCYGILPSDARWVEKSGMNPARIRIANRILAKVAAEHPDLLTVPDLKQYLCPSGRYQRGLGDVAVVRTDGVHFSEEGSDLLGAWLAPQLRES
jgi:hypothetical protein